MVKGEKKACDRCIQMKVGCKVAGNSRTGRKRPKRSGEFRGDLQDPIPVGAGSSQDAHYLADRLYDGLALIAGSIRELAEHLGEVCLFFNIFQMLTLVIFL